MKYILFLLFPFLIAAQGSIILDSPFDSSSELGSNGSTDWRNDIGTFDSGIITDGTARQGIGYVRLTNDLGGIRSEITRQYNDAPNAANGFYDWYTEYWIGYSIRVVEPVSGYAILTQFRPHTHNYTNTSGTNPYTLRNLSGNKFGFLWNTNASAKNTTFPSGAISGSIVYEYPYELGEWYDIVINFKLDPDNGFVRIWCNGDVVLNHVGTTTYNKAHDGSQKDPAGYVKLGLYYGPSNSTGEAHYDTFKVWKGSGGEYEDVSPLGLSIDGDITVPTPAPLEFKPIEQQLMLNKKRNN
ncbi:heparin lyase I family protein [Maribacter sp. Hel_I_7]|uniref:heparin lyase I family protein n=1 Tax=Maribacter sp. Hel_I_7 TaxID=1249997 RepID=UPI00047A1164|nr:heparin lyase I family protein [Maribacter sp. Hel_I_7]